MKLQFLVTILLMANVSDVRAAGSFHQMVSADTPLGGQSYSALSSVLVATNEPIGQVITAEYPQLQSVTFAFRVPTRLGGEGKQETLAVRLRAGNIEGEVLSSTTPVVLAWPGSIQPVQVGFQFMELPPLEVGQRYALQITHVAGDPIFDVFSYNPGPYAAGAMVYSGAQYDDKLGPDLWFMTGYVIPEPGTLALFTIGGTLLLWGRRRRAG